jgi:mono/diheme cytochrome c family protein
VKKIFKILLILLVVLCVLSVAGISLTIGWRPFIGPRARALTARKFESTPERLVRGKHIAITSGCIFCHSTHNWSAEGIPILSGMEFSGDVMPFFDMPGRVVTANLTPDPETGAGNWTDDQLARAIREGIGHDGRALFPMMPYSFFRKMSDEDLASVIVYLRSLPPVRHPLAPTQIIFPVKYLIRGVPQPVTEPVVAPDPSDRLKWGEYLVRMSICAECHTPSSKGKTPPGMAFAGGFPIEWSSGSVASANITPDASGISYYDEALFISVIRTGHVKARKLNPVMPYAYYNDYNDDDLKTIFGYLRTLKPVKHRVDNSLPPTQCKICGLKHGGGDQN